MKAARFLSIGLSAALALALKAHALITTHGREAVQCSGWSPQLTAIINHSARVSGQIGPLAPSARFQFSGKAEVFNRVFALYAALDQAERVLYLSADDGAGSDFELSVTFEGKGFLHLHLPGAIELAEVKIPAGVTVEAISPVGLPIDPEQRANADAEQERIKAFVAARRTTAAAAPSIQPGAFAPGIQALAADGNPVFPANKGDLPGAMANMHVLVVFWSMLDASEPGWIEPLTAIYREFRKGRFQIVSICIDDDFAAWIASLEDRRRINDRVWWQLTQAGSGTNCAGTFGVTTTPAAFLIQPNGRFSATNIPQEKLREKVATALDWDAP